MSADRWVETAAGWQGTLPVAGADRGPAVGLPGAAGDLAAELLGRIGPDDHELRERARAALTAAAAAERDGVPLTRLLVRALLADERADLDVGGVVAALEVVVVLW